MGFNSGFKGLKMGHLTLRSTRLIIPEHSNLHWQSSYKLEFRLPDLSNTHPTDRILKAYPLV